MSSFRDKDYEWDVAPGTYLEFDSDGWVAEVTAQRISPAGELLLHDPPYTLAAAYRSRSGQLLISLTTSLPSDRSTFDFASFMRALNTASEGM